MNGKQIKLEFLGKSYEEILSLMDATTITVGKWIVALGANSATFLPGNSVSIAEVTAQKAASDQVNIKLQLYPNARVNPVVFTWMEILLGIFEEFDSLYTNPVLNGVITVSAQTRIDTLQRLEEGFTALKTQQQEVVKAMVKELKIPK